MPKDREPNFAKASLGKLRATTIAGASDSGLNTHEGGAYSCIAEDEHASARLNENEATSFFLLLPFAFLLLTLGNDLRADAVCGKELQEERVWDPAVDQVHFSDAFVECFDG